MSFPDTPFDRLYAPHGSRPPLPVARPATRPVTLPVTAFVAVLLALLPATALANRPRPGFEATLPLAAPEHAPANGAIFNANAGYAGLVEGNRAHAVGDALSVVLVESLSTSKSALGKTQKSGSFAFTPPSKGPLSLIDGNALNASGNSAFNGQGNAAQTSSLGGTVEVTIAQVRPNGTALVKGEKRLLLSQGEEWVQVSGIVRFADITPDNTVQSTQVADARIVYTGNGSIGRASREGWLSKFFSIINPF